MRLAWCLLVVCGCSGDDAVELDAGEVDAGPADATDPDAIDAPLAACIPGSPPAVPPNGAPYCVTWTRLDGVQDAFARYYDGADVTTSGVRWRSEGLKYYTADAAIADGCLTVAGFSANGGTMRSDPIVLCWSANERACGEMTWRTPNEVSHWAVQLDACP